MTTPTFHRASRRICALAFLAGWAGPTAGALAQGAPAGLQSSIAGQVELARLIDLAAQRLHVSIDYDAAALKASVTLRLDAALSDQELWALMNRLLATRGFTTVRAGEHAYSVVKVTDAANLSSPAGGAGPPPGFRVEVVRLAHRASKEVVEAAGKVLSKPGGAITPIGDGGLVMISDLSPRVDQALELIKLLDLATVTVTRGIAVHNLTAQALVTLATQVENKRESVSGEKVPGEVLASPTGAAVLLICPAEREGYWQELISSLDQREQVVTQSYSPRTFALGDVSKLVEQTVKDAPGLPPDERWRMVQDDLTGALIVTATPSQHEQIAALVERLNAASATPTKPVRSFVIKNRPVHELQAVLEQLLTAGVIGVGAASAEQPSGTAPSDGLQPWPPPASGPAAGTGASGSAAVLGATTANGVPSTPPPATQRNTPAFRASGPNGNSTHDASGAPAHPQPAVTFTCDEVTNTLIAMGEPRVLAQVEGLIKSLDVRQPQVMLEVLLVSLNDSQTVDLGVELEKIGVIGDVGYRLSSLFGLGARGAGGDRTAGDGSGGTALVLSPGDFSILIRALQTINHGRSLSMPKVLVGNNQQGTIDSVLDQPYASTNASNTVTTTSFGGSKQAGTQVTIKPQIGAAEHLNLQYSVSLSSFAGAAPSPNLPPPLQENKVQSNATIPDGYTIAVGGIDLSTEGNAVSQIPGIARIPLVGELFKNRSKNSSHTRFYVFIRATVMRSSTFEDLKFLSDQSVAVAGIDDGFPVVEPRVIR